MFNIKIKDNNYSGFKLTNQTVSNFTQITDSEKTKVIEALKTISNVPLAKLAKDGFIVFPRSNAAESDLANQDKIISVQDLESDNPTIKTGNIMGFFTVNDTVQIEIHSRFDDSGKQYFLHHMLSKVCNIAPTKELIEATSKNPLHNFAVYLFPAFLKRALEQGLFRTYVTREYNDSNIRGPIDFPRHIKQNMPFNGKIAYRTREFSSNNPLTHLIRHTIEFIDESHNMHSILAGNARTDVAAICACTENYRRSERTIIIAKNSRPITSPFYSEYENLRKLCLMILNREKHSYTSNDTQINGIIFDVASLWEDYLATLFAPKGFLHPKNRERLGGIRMFDNSNTSEDPELTFDKNYRKIYPDFYKPNKDDKSQDGFILDAKYKHLQNGVGREDLFQVVTYMHTMKINSGGFIYPANFPDFRNLKLANDGGIIKICGMKIPTNKDKFDDFCEEMKDQENQLFNRIEI
ncbi:hypothetical protein IKS86_05595 [bacterium]|nr:hypothetical protein [bacterium]